MKSDLFVEMIMKRMDSVNEFNHSHRWSNELKFDIQDIEKEIVEIENNTSSFKGGSLLHEELDYYVGFQDKLETQCDILKLTIENYDQALETLSEI